MSDVLTIANVQYSFGNLLLIKNISFAVVQGGAVVICGRSGCGKSTLLELCAGLRSPIFGEVCWEGKSLSGLNHEHMTAARQRIGYVFQKHALIHNFTVYDNIALPLRYHLGLSEKDVRIKVKAALDDLGLFNVDAKFPNQLSAGQSKCAALARALVLQPRLLFMDEPTAGVDPFTAECMVNVINNYRETEKLTVCVISNDFQIIRQMQSPVKILEEGKLFDFSETGVLSDAREPAIIEYYRKML